MFMHALHLAAEIGVAGRVDDVDLDLLLDRIADGDGRVLGQDGDAALALQVVGVHDALGHLLVVAEDVRLSEQAVDQRGLAVVDVGDDGDIANVVRSFFIIQLLPSEYAQRPRRLTAGVARQAYIISNSAGLEKVHFFSKIY